MANIRALLNLVDVTITESVAVTTSASNTSPAIARVQPYLNELKEVAADNRTYLVNAFKKYDDNAVGRLVICEALQHEPDSVLDSFFIELLDGEPGELAICSSIALGKTGCARAKPLIAAWLSRDTSVRQKFYFGLAMLLLKDERGTQALREVLKKESNEIRFEDGKIFAATNEQFYCVRIDLIFSHLFPGERSLGNPFYWPLRTKLRTNTVEKRLWESLPRNLINYYAPLQSP